MSTSARYAYIDSLRGIAALLVVWLHVAEVFLNLNKAGADATRWAYTLAHEFDFGRIGVVAFFAISGFVIPGSLRGPRLAGLRTFAIRRFFRLYPLFWASIPLGIASIWWLYDRPVSLGMVLANATMVPQALGAEPVIGLYWTLQTELVFYLLCAALFALGLLHHPLVRLLASGGLATGFVLAVGGYTQAYLGWTPAPETSFMLFHLGIMFWGACARDVVDAGEQGRPQRWLWAALAIATVAVAAPPLRAAWYGYVGGDANLYRFAWPYLLGIGLFALGVFVVRIHLRLNAWLGEISYSIYLLHPVAFYAVYRVLERSGIAWLKTAPLLLHVLFCMLLSVLLAALAYRWIERPAIALGQRLSRARNASLRVAVPEAAAAP